jgi:hypothetical protein
MSVHSLALQHDGQRKRVAHMRTATTTAKAAADQNRLERAGLKNLNRTISGVSA